MTLDQVGEYQIAVLDINVEEWYDLIKEETFATEFVPLTIDDAKAFIQAYEQTQNVDKLKETPKISDDVWEKLKPLERVRSFPDPLDPNPFLRLVLSSIYWGYKCRDVFIDFYNIESPRKHW